MLSRSDPFSTYSVLERERQREREVVRQVVIFVTVGERKKKGESDVKKYLSPSCRLDSGPASHLKLNTRALARRHMDGGGT